MKKWICIFLLPVGLTAIVSSHSHALSSYLDLFNTTYGSAGTRLDRCKLCHTTNSPNTNSARNPFGLDFGSSTRVPGHTIHVFDAALENFDSDGDGSTNIVEINARTFPGNPASKPGIIITITDPNGTQVIPAGSVYTILYDAPAEVSSVKVKYSMDGGVTWLPAVGTPGAAAGSFDWDVPTPVKNTTKALVKVIGFDALNVKLASDESDRPFTIEAVSITAPVADEIVPKGSVYSVTWFANVAKGSVSNAKVFYTFGSSGIWKHADGILVDPFGSFDWNVPSPAKTKIVKLKVVLEDASGVTVGKAVSDAFIVQ